MERPVTQIAAIKKGERNSFSALCFRENKNPGLCGGADQAGVKDFKSGY